MTDRTKWAQVLPVIQAFVAGEPIQCRDYTKRWVDTSTMSSVMCGNEYRIRPKDLVDGTWFIEYEETEPGSLSGVVKRGTMCWKGSNKDTPPWKESQYIKLTRGSETFVSNKETS